MKEHSSFQHSFHAAESPSRGLRRVGSAGSAFVIAAGLLVVAPVEAADLTVGQSVPTVESLIETDDLTFESTELLPGIVSESPYRGSAVTTEALGGQSETSTNATTNSPTNAFFEDGTHWSIVNNGATSPVYYDLKGILIARIISR